MKKSYIKPEVQVISYTLNDAIAASSCAAPIMNHSRELSCKGINDKYKDKYDFPPVMTPTFGQGEDCDIEFDGYCYYTSTQTMLFSS